MEIRTEKKLVERVVDTYIAVDGKEFDNKIDCENYEKELESAEGDDKEKLEKDIQAATPMVVDTYRNGGIRNLLYGCGTNI